MPNLFKNPYLNSIFAEIYIILVVSLMNYFGEPNTPDTFLDPVAALSLFVLSAAIMGFLFLGQPLQLYLNGEKKQAATFFMKTVLSFAVMTLVVVVLLKQLR